MKLLSRYIIRKVWVSTVLVTLVLAGLQLFILFVNQFTQKSSEDYGVAAMIVYVLLQMPYRIYLFFPMSSLLGCMLALGVLANHYELNVMRAAGLSIIRISMPVLKASFIIIIFMTLVGELLAPKLAYLANSQKIQAVSNGDTLRTSKGEWLHLANDYIFVAQVISKIHLRGVHQFRFDSHHQLVLARKINQVDYENGVWHAHGIAETLFYKNKTQAKTMQSMPWKVLLNPAYVYITKEPEEMSLVELADYIKNHKKSRQVIYNYELIYYQRLIQPMTTLIMIMLAIPFVFGPLRNTTVGSKLLTGVVLGLSFQLIQRFFGPLSELLQWPAEVAVFVPSCIFALLGFYLIYQPMPRFFRLSYAY